MKRTIRVGKHRVVIGIALMVVAFVLMSLLLYEFSHDIQENQRTVGQERLHEITMQNVGLVETIVQDKITFIEAVANMIALQPDLASAETITILNKFCEKEEFERLAIDFSNGESYTSDGYQVDISDMGYADRIPQGKTFITDLVFAKIDGEPSISIIAPILQDGKAVAAVRGTFYTRKFGDLMDVDFLGGVGYFHLLNSRGEYMAVSQSSEAILMDMNYFDAIEKLSFDPGFSAQKLELDIANGLGGQTAYAFEGKTRYVEYQPVKINDWYLMVLTPKWVIDQNAQVIQGKVASLMIKLLLVALAVFLFILYSMKASRDEIRQINDQLILGEKRYLFMLERSDNVIFEYTLADNSMEFSERFFENFGYSPVSLGYPEQVVEEGQIPPEDGPVMARLLDEIKSGKPNASVELRIRNRVNDYVWCQVSTVTIFGDDGTPVKALGVIENIDAQRKKEMALITLAEQDQLTGLYNKVTTESLIRSFLENGANRHGIHALMIIDVDDFKLVNDTLGHLYGDVVLSKLAKGLRPVFRETDVVGRIGGDEFFVFMKNIDATQTALDRAAELNEIFRQTHQENGIECKISASIGVALFPEHGLDFESLYRHADSALYVSKANGKDRHYLYDGSIGNYTSHRTEIVHTKPVDWDAQPS